ncbi:hypothetical protein [Pseudomonas khavaziana]|uniref:hypothetical protein n=1 Tax=Pseudomonas khavaziana TaxID=2842351 RepID=UPI001C3CFE66|nr:hypothetical protein [Pseudomonas khavaziana]MBV4479861.1 hypothetical protein [Pseudomonas khavaziana]
MFISENPYAAPQADLKTPSTGATTFFIVAPRKLVLMVLLSQGFYTFYWLYKHWSAYRAATGARVLPIVRAFFSIFFLYALVMKIKQALDLKDPAYRWWPRCFVLGWIICAFLPFTYVWFVSSLTALKVGLCFAIAQVAMSVQIQHAVNHLENDLTGQANHRLTWANGIWICIGVSFWVIAISSALGLGAVVVEQ